MKAMVLAAGVGSRLRPLTDRTPKAAVEVAGLSMLEIVFRRLIKAGVTEAIVNTHHLAAQVTAILKQKNNFGIRVEVSHETELLETGGGLKKAAAFFDDGKPFILHNVDIYTDLDLGRLYQQHLERPALATLSVRRRATSRRFLFNAQERLVGWEDSSKGEKLWAGPPVDSAEALAFDGVQVLSPEIFAKLTETGAFSITKAYLRLAGEGEFIRAFRADEFYWRDIGSLARLEEVRKTAAEKGLGV